jgi:thioredoxin reductase
MGYQPVIVDQAPELGGQLLKIDRLNAWVLGNPGKTSIELAHAYADHIRTEEIETRSETTVIDTLPRTDGWALSVEKREGERTVEPFSRIVVASGTRVRTREAFGNVPGFEATWAAGLISFWPLDHLHREADLRGKRIAVIGGGDNAHFTAADLAPIADQLYLIARSPPTAQPTVRSSIQALIESHRVMEYPDARITGFAPMHQGVQVDVLLRGTESIRIEVDMIFARTGFIPNSDFLRDSGPLAGIERSAAGYLRTDADKRTSLRGIYAIGDVAEGANPSVVASIADGAVAARTIARDEFARPDGRDDQ